MMNMYSQMVEMYSNMMKIYSNMMKMYSNMVKMYSNIINTRDVWSMHYSKIRDSDLKCHQIRGS